MASIVTSNNNNSIFYVPQMKVVPLSALEQHQNFHFGVNYPFKKGNSPLVNDQYVQKKETF